MDVWGILGIERTADTKVIKRAYAKMLKNYHPEDDPEGFMRLRKAYEAALEQAHTVSEDAEIRVFDISSFEDSNQYLRKNLSKLEDNSNSVNIRSDKEEFPKDKKEQLLQKVELLYSDIFKRREVKFWQDLFAELTVDEYHYLTDKAWDFFNKNCSLPYEVWKFINSEFSIFEDERFRWTKVVQHDFGLSFDCFDQSLTVDYSSYAENRFYAFECFVRGDYKSTVQHIQEAEKIFCKDFVLYRLKGIALYLMRNYTQAIEAFSSALSLNGNDLEMLLFRGNAFLNNSEYKKATMDFYIVLKTDMDNVDGLKGMIMCFCAQKKYRSADKYFRIFMKKCPLGDVQIGMLLDECQRDRLMNKVGGILNRINKVNDIAFNEETALFYCIKFTLITFIAPPVLYVVLLYPKGYIYIGILILLYLTNKILKRKSKK